MYKIRQSQGDKGGRDDDEFVQNNFFWGLNNNAIREALRPQLDQHENFNALLKEAQCLESDYERCHTKKARANAVTTSENNVSDGDGLEERFQKMESGLLRHVQEQIAAVQQQTTYQDPCGWGEEATEEDIEVEVDTEEVTKEIIKEYQINKVEIMVQKSKEKGIMKIKDNLSRIMGINRIQVK